MTGAWIVQTQTGSSATACAVGVLTAFNGCWATSRTRCRPGVPPRDSNPEPADQKNASMPVRDLPGTSDGLVDGMEWAVDREPRATHHLIASAIRHPHLDRYLEVEPSGSRR